MKVTVDSGLFMGHLDLFHFLPPSGSPSNYSVQVAREVGSPLLPSPLAVRGKEGETAERERERERERRKGISISKQNNRPGIIQSPKDRNC